MTTDPTTPSEFCLPLRSVQAAGAMRRLGAEMAAVGLEGPVLIVAGATPIARLAPVWATALEDVGMAHRVRLFGGESSQPEIAAIVEEAQSLGARTIVAAGEESLIDAARSAAAALRLPFVPCPTSCSADPSNSG
jgi:glycerol dehydrogenase-like iron-containing ADH family enzyme